MAVGTVSLWGTVARAQFDAPVSYYSTATGSGATLFTQLRTIVSTMTPVNYGNARFSAAITDVDPNNASNILLVYNRASVSSVWDAGVTFNREHVWPDSRLGAGADNPSNTYTGPASDQINLRPCNPGINSSHSNLNFGTGTSTGVAGTASGGFWYPGDTDLGDVARSCFYMTTRWSQLTLQNGNPSTVANTNPGNYGDLAAMLSWHYRDGPDTFERRRNHAIYGQAGAPGSPAISNIYAQGNRNPYVDNPEWVWSVFGGGLNNTRLRVATADANGGSATTVDVGRVLVGGTTTATQNVTITKEGTNGTYYSVTPGVGATSSVTGKFNAFGLNTTGSRTVAVGFNGSTATPGLKTSGVTVNNLDISTGGTGFGSADADDTVSVNLSVLTASNSSFALGTDTNVLNLDFGFVLPDSVVAPQAFSIFNLASAAFGSAFTARMDFVSIIGSGSTSLFSTNVGAFSNLNPDAALGFTATFLPTALSPTTLPALVPAGLYSAQYLITLRDENLSGTRLNTTLTLNVSGRVRQTVVPEPGALALFVPAGMLLARRRARG